jgi:hypothetical protein
VRPAGADDFVPSETLTTSNRWVLDPASDPELPLRLRQDPEVFKTDSGSIVCSNRWTGVDDEPRDCLSVSKACTAPMRAWVQIRTDRLRRNAVVRRPGRALRASRILFSPAAGCGQ